MNKRKTIYSFLLLLFLLAAILYLIVSFPHRKHPLEVIFLNVGQGDAILLSQGSSQILIDGGIDGTLLLEKLGKYVPFWDRNIETVIATHPDQDHIGGLGKVLQTYRVGNFIETTQQSTSGVYKALEQKIAEKKIIKTLAQSGEKISFSEGGELSILFPFAEGEKIEEKNNNLASIVSKLTFGRSAFLFMGDLPSEKESELVSRGVDVTADVLKVGHHGSKYSNSSEFLDAVAPHDAVISVGKDNMYGHPNPEALARLKAHHINILRTDEMGDIVYECRDMSGECVLQK